MLLSPCALGKDELVRLMETCFQVAYAHKRHNFLNTALCIVSRTKTRLWIIIIKFIDDQNSWLIDRCRSALAHNPLKHQQQGLLAEGPYVSSFLRISKEVGGSPHASTLLRWTKGAVVIYKQAWAGAGCCLIDAARKQSSDAISNRLKKGSI